MVNHDAETSEVNDAVKGGVRAPVGEAGVVYIRLCPNDSNIRVQTALDATVGELKALLARNCDVPEDLQSLIYNGRILKDDRTLVSYGVETNHTIQLVRAHGVASATPSSSSATNAGVSGAPNSISSGTLSNMSLESLMNGLDGLGIGGFENPDQPSDVLPEMFVTQLSQLQEEGFFDTEENIRILTLTAGNVHAALERLRRNSGQ